ncbi:MAG: CPBP family intramembrane metalloprotease [Acidobacteria bacterium]|nr:CPBP family intramembrane metalloprotease [Acidobacteriota bacterium]
METNLPQDPPPEQEAAATERQPVPGAAQPAAAPDAGPPDTWNYLDVGVVTLFALGTQILVYLGGLLVMLLLAGSAADSLHYMELMTKASFILPAQLVWWTLVFWVVYRVVRARDARPFPRAIGWVRPPGPVAAYLGAGVALAFSVAGLSRLIPMPKQKLPIEQLFRDPFSAFLIAAFGVLVAPVIEELLFRGFLYPVMERAHGAFLAVFGTASLFSLMHAQQYGWNWQNLLLLLFVGVVFGAVRAFSRSLVPSTLAHAAYNFTLFAGLYFASNRFQHFNF